MQDINLLQNKVKDRTLQYERSNRLVLILFSFLVILELVAGVGLYLLEKTTNTQAQQVAADSIKIQQSIDSQSKDLNLAKGLQAQLKNVNSLVKDRLYWSEFLNQIQALTPVKVQYTIMDGGVDTNAVHLEGNAPSYADVGRLLLSLSTSDKFKDVKLQAVNPNTGSSSFGYHFTVDVKANNSAFTKDESVH